LDQTISLPQGGYVIIEHTEALHVIDVNSGNKSNQESDQETTALKTNLVAAKEIARQLRLRDMGGIIVIDFIDMKKADNKKAIYDAMRQEMKDDRSKNTVLPLTKFGLMQITRQRVRPEVNIVTKETCPSCNGTGKIQASILVADQLEKDLEHIATIPKCFEHPNRITPLPLRLFYKRIYFAKSKVVFQIPQMGKTDKRFFTPGDGVQIPG
jgi:ribonuclease G